MLPVPFTFAGRVGRWSYFKWSIGMVAACFLPVLLALSMYSELRAGNSAAIIGLCVILGLFAVTMAWITLALQVRRIRDIGWDPLYVIVGWFVLQVVDLFLVQSVPAMVIGRHHETTLLGALVNLFMAVALMFWPSTDRDMSGPSMPAPRLPERPLPPAPGEGLGILTATRAASAPARVAFGRR